MTRAAVSQATISRAIKAAKAAGMTVARCEVLPDGTIVLFESTQEPLNDAFGKWAAKRESRTQRAASDKA